VPRTSPPLNASLTWDNVRVIRELARKHSSMSYTKLARMFGVAPSTIANCVQGLTWKERGYDPPKRARAKLTWPMVREIRRRYAAGEVGRVLAAEFGVSNVAVHFVVTGRNWQHDPDGNIYVPEPLIRGTRPKLTPDQVRAIITNVKRATNVQLAMQFEVSEQLIGRIRKGTYRRAA
jgi:hypothetical protein